jgi:hypothetical protein
MIPTDTLAAAGRDIVVCAAEKGMTLRLIGGVAVWVRSRDETRKLLGRSYGDLDFVSQKTSPRDLTELLGELGYADERRFNAVHGERRLLYNAPDGSIKIDVFRDRFEMCHSLDLRDRLALDDVALSAADLALTKLQVAELNRKDLVDIYMLLIDHVLGHDDEATVINVDRIVGVCASDWGWYTTVTDNLTKAAELATEVLGSQDDHAAIVTARLNELAVSLDAAPKSFAWRARAKLGRRMAWRDSPEEVG